MAISPPLDLVAWAGEFLRAAGYPTTRENYAAVVAWARAEGGHNVANSAYNPLNTTRNKPGAVTINSHGVKSYPSRAVGLEATLETIRLSYYTAVVAALKAGNSAVAVADALWNGGRSPRWGTNRELMVEIIPSARRQVDAAGTGATTTGAAPTTPSPAVAASAGGPLAGPAPDAPPRIIYSLDLRDLIVYGTRIWADIGDAVTSARLSLSTGEVSALELTLEDPGHMLLASGIFDKRLVSAAATSPDGDITTAALYAGASTRLGDLALELASLEVTAGTAGRGGLNIAYHSAGVTVLRQNRGPIVRANMSSSELIAELAGSMAVVAQQSPRRPSIWVTGYEAGEATETDPVTGLTTARGAAREAESYWAAFQRWAQEEGFWCFEAAGVIYYGTPSFLVDYLPTTSAVWDPGGTGGTAAILDLGARRTYATPDAANEPDEITLALDRRYLRAVRQWVPGGNIELRGLPRFESTYIITSLDVDIAATAGVATVTAAKPVDPDPTGYPEDPEADATADGAVDPADPTAGGTGGTDPDGPRPNELGWVDPTAGAGNWSHNFGQQRPTHVHAGIDLSVPVGTVVYAARAGTMSTSTSPTGYGNLIKITHADGFETRYAHMSTMRMGNNRPVAAGERIGLSGGAKGAAGAGNSTGPHVHFEVRKDGQPTNPSNYYPAR